MSFFSTITSKRSRQIWNSLQLTSLPVLLLVWGTTVIPLARADIQPDTPGNRFVKLELITDRAVIQPKDSNDKPATRIGAHLTIERGWHIYWQNSGDSGMPTKLTWSIPPEWHTGELRWPAPEKFLERGGLITYGYRDEVVLVTDLFAPVIIPSSGLRAELSVSVNFLVCRDICVPGSATSSLSLPFSTDAPETPSQELALIDRFDKLTPQPLANISSLGWADGFSIDAFASHSAVAPKEQGYFGVILQRFPFTEPLTRVQFFPQKTDGLKIGIAQGREFPLGAPDMRTAPSGPGHRVLLQAPLTVLSSVTSPVTKRLSGIIVLETPARQPTAYEVTAQLTLGDHSTPDPRWDELIKNAGEPGVLTYRSHDTTKSDLPNQSAPGAQPPRKLLSWSLLVALLSAFVAGIILNLMPCVLPIISIKVLCILKEAHCTQRQRTVSALVYSAGILATFLVLALTVLALKEIGYHVGWGFQFQQPTFVFGLFLVVFLLSLSLFEVFVLYVPGMQRANKLVSSLKPSLFTNFFDGMLATLLSTPCTAPFLGTALAFAFTQPPLITVLIFQAIGLGLALPYVYLVTHPGLMCRLPKPGEWMNRFKQFMGFLMLATALWLLFILHRLSGEGALWAVSCAFMIFFALWINLWIREGGASPARKRVLRTLLNCYALLFIIRLWPLATALHLSPIGEITRSDKIAWELFSEEALARARAEGRKVFIDFTAEWCVTCKFNERFAIETDNVAQVIREQNVLALKADWTDGNIAVTEALNRFGAQGVPHYVVLPPSGAPRALPTLVTAKTVSDAIKAP